MKKLLLPLLCILFSLPSCHTDDYRSESLKSFALQGNVRSATLSYYPAIQKDGEWQPEHEDSCKYRVKISFRINGECRESLYLLPDGKETARTSPTFKDGRMTEEISYDGNGDIFLKTKFNKIDEYNVGFKAYDKNNELIDEGTIEYNVFGFTKLYTRKASKSTLFYDDKNNLTTIVHSGKNRNTVTIKYLEFDHKKNWTKRVEMAKDTSLVTREIVYY